MPANPSPPGSIVRIARLNLNCLVPRDHLLPEVVRGQLRSIAESNLQSVCARQLAPLCPENDPSVWFIRRLDIGSAVDARWEPDRLAKTLSEPIERALRHKLCDGTDGAEALCFPDRAAYLAQFLRDLADGVAWSKWYYDQWEGLRALPTNATIREALSRNPAIGETGLLQLVKENRAGKVLSAMTEADCRAVLSAFCAMAAVTETGGITASHLQVAWEAWQSNRELSRELPARHHTTLQLYLAFRNGDAPPASALLQAIRAAQVAEQVRAPATNSAHADGVQAREPLFTPFGGVFWLLPRIEDLKLEECAAALPDFQNNAPAALVRFLVLLKCLGAPRAPHAFFDPVLREVVGMSPDLRDEEIRAWARQVTPERTLDFQVRWLAHCRHQGMISRRWLCVRPARRGRLLLLADGERDTWLYLARSIQELIQYLEAGLQPKGNDPYSTLPAVHALLCDPALVGMLPVSVSDVAVRAWNSSEAAAWSADDALLATCLERARLPDEDLAYLSLVSLLRGTRHLDLALSLAARSVVRSFAWRLPGFAWSSADFIYTNFLDVTATVEPQADDWLVHIARPPLHIVLAMTGAAEDTYHVSWLDKREVRLTTSAS
jgi:hypothetical protein